MNELSAYLDSQLQGTSSASGETEGVLWEVRLRSNGQENRLSVATRASTTAERFAPRFGLGSVGGRSLSAVFWTQLKGELHYVFSSFVSGGTPGELAEKASRWARDASLELKVKENLEEHEFSGLSEELKSLGTLSAVGRDGGFRWHVRRTGDQTRILVGIPRTALPYLSESWGEVVSGEAARSGIKLGWWAERRQIVVQPNSNEWTVAVGEFPTRLLFGEGAEKAQEWVRGISERYNSQNAPLTRTG